MRDDRLEENVSRWFPRLLSGRWDEAEARLYLELVLAALALEKRQANTTVPVADFLKHCLAKAAISAEDLQTLYHLGRQTAQLETRLQGVGLPGLLRPHPSWLTGVLRNPN